MYEDIKEQIAVVAVFKNGHAIPYLFAWKGRKYVVTGVNLEHQERRGDELLFCYSITASGNFFELSFNNRYLVWTLERVWEE